MLQKLEHRLFPGGPMVRTLCFHCRGRGFNPWSGELRSYTAHSMAKKKKKNESTIIHPEATRCFLRHFSDVSSAGLWESSGLVMNANFIFTQMCRYIEWSREEKWITENFQLQFENANDWRSQFHVSAASCLEEKTGLDEAWTHDSTFCVHLLFAGLSSKFRISPRLFKNKNAAQPRETAWGICEAIVVSQHLSDAKLLEACTVVELDNISSCPPGQNISESIPEPWT